MAQRKRILLDKVHDAFKTTDFARQCLAVHAFLKSHGVKSRATWSDLVWIADWTVSKFWIRVLHTIGAEDMNDILNDTHDVAGSLRRPWVQYPLDADEEKVATVLRKLIPEFQHNRTIVQHGRQIDGVDGNCRCNNCL